ncbi:hypothetical protein [Streptosporangium roseum]|nr:hypothetical protein [Streptosporangium roseum]
MQLAKSDPAWPVPQVEWQQVGRYWLIPWDDCLKSYFTARDCPATWVNSARVYLVTASLTTGRNTPSPTRDSFTWMIEGSILRIWRFVPHMKSLR